MYVVFFFFFEISSFMIYRYISLLSNKKLSCDFTTKVHNNISKSLFGFLFIIYIYIYFLYGFFIYNF